ncbi:unnamed protein product [Allacma fusca]|uniref:Uncharacterized protein n=1 Tax=Allacma fusca TaxID=39272 RepID=A0A8J2L5P2_9HEXA|nr:unnamed protein product [Allacma fusca]
MTWFGNGSQYHGIGRQLGISKSTVHRCIKSVCKAVIETLLADEVRWKIFGKFLLSSCSYPGKNFHIARKVILTLACVFIIEIGIHGIKWDTDGIWNLTLWMRTQKVWKTQIRLLWTNSIA